MTRLAWGATGERFYETGVDRGVLYVDGVGHAWNGLTSVEESPTGGEAKPYYFDGLKYANIPSFEEFEATINAFSAPKAFLDVEGTASVARGFYATQQPRKPFSFSYRTLIASDTNEIGSGYKLHIVYIALAGPSSRENVTLSDTPEPMELSWEITATPPLVHGHRPTSHFVIDSTEASPIILGWLESIMYGTAEKQPRLPRLDEILTMFGWETDSVDYPVEVIGEWDSPKETITNAMPPNPAVGDGYVIDGQLWVWTDKNYWQQFGTPPVTL